MNKVGILLLNKPEAFTLEHQMHNLMDFHSLTKRRDQCLACNSRLQRCDQFLPDDKTRSPLL